MKIVSLRAENIKRLKAVRIDPKGNLVQITGKNGNGKTSVMDSIWWAVAGASNIQSVPIRKGQNKALIRLDLGEIVITRTFTTKADGSEFTTSVVVEAEDGARFTSPQRILDALMDALCFDPLAFARAPGPQQLEQLKRFVPGVDFAKIAGLQKADYDRRTDVNRLLKQERAAALAIVMPDGTPEELVDEAALTQQLASAVDHNSTLKDRKARRERYVTDIAQLREAAGHVTRDVEEYTRERADEAAVRCKEIQDEIDRLVAQMKQVTDKAAADIQATSQKIVKQAGEAAAKADQMQTQLDNAEALPAAIDVDAVRLAVDTARTTNANVRRLLERKKHEAAASELHQRSEILTATIQQREADKAAAIAAAQMPVPGLGFGEDHITLAGVPFDQASDAEQLRASVAIAMATNPKLRVIRVRDGSLLDEEALRILGQIADEQDFQVWVERVDSSGKIGFVIEDGELKGAFAAVAEEEPVEAA